MSSTGSAHASDPADLLTIGELADRTGAAPSALRFYESEGLIGSERSSGGQRRYHREVLRRVSYIRIAQQVGLSLGEIRESLESLPDGRTPTKADWARLSRGWRPRLDEHIAMLDSGAGQPHRMHRVRLPLAAILCALQRQ